MNKLKHASADHPFALAIGHTGRIMNLRTRSSIWRPRPSTLFRSLALVLVAAFLAAACGSGDETTAAAVPGSESDFPSFTAQTVGGSQLDYGSLEGQDTVLWFWAPW